MKVFRRRPFVITWAILKIKSSILDVDQTRTCILTLTSQNTLIEIPPPSHHYILFLVGHLLERATMETTNAKNDVIIHVTNQSIAPASRATATTTTADLRLLSRSRRRFLSRRALTQRQRARERWKLYETNDGAKLQKAAARRRKNRATPFIQPNTAPTDFLMNSKMLDSWRCTLE